MIYITTLLHDIAKGRPEDHSIAGAKVARRLCPRLGFNAADTELVAWLIEEHLTMSTVAQSRDLSDRKTIENFAAVVQSVEQMKLLDHPDHRRHPRRRPGRVERLEGAAAAHALLRDRAGADRRLLGSEPRPAHRRGAGRIPRRPSPNGRRPSSTPISPGIIRPTGSRSSCRARSATPASCAPANRPATSSRSMSASTRRAASPSSRFSRPTIPGCCRSSRAPAPRPAPTSSTRRSTPRPTAARSTPSRSPGNTTATRTRAGAPPASAR